MILERNTQWLRQQAELNPESPAIISGNTEFNFSQYYDASGKFAALLKSKGVKENENVAIFSNNNANFLFLVNAIWQIGAVPVPINTRLLPDEISKQINFVDAACLFYESTYENIAEEISFKIKFPIPKLSALVNSAEKIDFAQGKSETALILFTSGSTKKPRAVQLSFENLFQSVSALDKMINMQPKDKWVASLPFYHIGGFSIITRALLSGSNLVIPSSLKAEDIAGSFVKHSPTLISLVPTMLSRLIESKISPNENLRCVFLGGGPMRKELISDALKLGWNIYSVYGSTETCSMVTALTPDEQIENAGSAGKHLGDNRIEILPLPKAQQIHPNTGIISVAGNSVMNGYYKEATKHVRNGNTYDTDDVGFIDENGYLYVLYRKDEIIISGGENINMQEISGIISEIENVSECFLFALPDELWGSILCAAVVSNSNELNESKLRSELKDKIASYKIPKKFFFLEKLPKTELGKIDRTKLLGLLNL